MGTDKQKSLLAAAAELRQRAEEQLHASTVVHPPRAGEAQHGVNHGLEELEVQNEELLRIQMELETQQIELEMQNEELHQARDEIEASRDRYTELYDFAPVAYFTFDAHGVIHEVNH
jgi:formate hydrogenlyase transcriptional activator